MKKENMDNDLSDIMKEIEALEEDFRNEEKAFAKSPIIQELAQLNEELSAPVGHKTEAAAEEEAFDWLSEDQNKEEPLAGPAPAPAAEVLEMKAPEVKKEAPVVAHTPNKSKMSFNFPEGMPVNVEFHRGPEALSFSWTEEGFHVEVEGGMSFTIPFSHCYSKAS